MTGKSTEHSRLVDAIVEGTPIEAPAPQGDDPALAQLRVLLEIARVHREALAVDGAGGATVGASPPISIGRSVSRWTHLYLIECIGQGASGFVYRAWDSRLAREVALKLMSAGELSASSLVEARRMARVRHPHFVSVYGADQADGQVGVWMELLKGRTLHELVRTQGPFSAREAALVGADVCTALAAVHGAGLLHRDVKAQNVVREHGGRTVLMDLGAGREIAGDTSLDLAGTPLYMAPELFTGTPATVQTDVYSLGVLLFFLTTGSVPVAAESLSEIRTAHAEGRSRSLRDVRPDLPRGFVDVVDRALSREPAARFASAGEMERSLLATVVAREPDAPDTARTTLAGRVLSRKLPVWTMLPIAAIAGLLAMFFTSPFTGSAASDAKRQAAASVDSVRPLSADQAKIARGFEELASTLASRGQWEQAAAQYAEAERIYRLNTSPDAPLVAAALARLAWAQQHAGQLDVARGNYELAIAKFENFGAGPLTEVTLVALASLQQAAGRYEDSIHTLDRALTLRSKILLESVDEKSGLQRIGVSAATLAQSMRSRALESDSDADWLPDVIEAAAGLNPDARDSDGDGVPDSEEDQDGDGVSNLLEFGVTADPTKIVAHYGALDPEWLGFQQPDNRRFTGRPADASAPAAAWKVAAPGQNMYYRSLTSAEKAAALSRGWRLMTRGTLHAGGAFANIDLEPGPRFDLEFFLNARNGVDVQLSTKVVPFEGIIEKISEDGSWKLTELQYDPLLEQATLFVDGVRRSTTYRGHHQFQEKLGLFFGTWDLFGKTPSAEADLNLVVFVIR